MWYNRTNERKSFFKQRVILLCAEVFAAGENTKYLQLLSRDFPTPESAWAEIINLNALLKLPKGTEHFMSDLHEEYEAFIHILNNGSGVIREKVDRVLSQQLTPDQRAEFATLIYYPSQKLPELLKKYSYKKDFYLTTLMQLLEVCRMVSSKHTRSFVRKALPQDFAYILDELLHAHFEDHDKEAYYHAILQSIVDTQQADAFIEALCALIKKLAVLKLHIVGDVFDRGPRPDIIIDHLIHHHSVDIQWGNHDVVWMGAASGSALCIATVLNTSFAYNNLEFLEDGYGINLRPLATFADNVYKHCNVSRFAPKVDPSRGDISPQKLAQVARMRKAIAVIMFKLECAVIDRNPDFQMERRKFLQQIDFEKKIVCIDGAWYKMEDTDLPTVDIKNPHVLTPDERELMQRLCHSFQESEKLNRHIRFLYDKGSVYHIENGNLLYHGAIPLTLQGDFAQETFDGNTYSGKALMDYCDCIARNGYFSQLPQERQKGQDFLWYLWCGHLSPLFGRSKMATFERLFVADESCYQEEKNPYYQLIQNPMIDRMILKEFGLNDNCHIVNGHVPVQANKGESPIKGSGRLIVIDGGFCRAYHEKTGTAGYTLVFNSRGMSLRAHQPFETTQKAIDENIDILSTVNIFETTNHRLLVEDTDEGKQLLERIADLKELIQAYHTGKIKC